jgi:hypothetical protein
MMEAVGYWTVFGSSYFLYRHGKINSNINPAVSSLRHIKGNKVHDSAALEDIVCLCTWDKLMSI